MVLKLARLSCAAIIVLPFLFVSLEANATGCVKNNAGYVANITWWGKLKDGQTPAVYLGVDGNGDATTFNLADPDDVSTPLQEKKPTIGLRPCAPADWEPDDLVAVRVSGAKWVAKTIDLAAVGLAVGMCLGGAALLDALFPPAAAAAPAQVSGCMAGGVAVGVKVAGSFGGSILEEAALPHADEIFILTQIPKGCELRLGGTVFKPKAQLYKVGVTPKQLCDDMSYDGVVVDDN